jgi:hypothetical protein
VVALAEIPFPRLQDVELRALLEVLDDLHRVVPRVSAMALRQMIFNAQ